MNLPRTLSLLLAALAVASTSAEIHIPAFTAYLTPEPEAVSVSEKSGISGWKDAKTKVIWYGELGGSGEVSAAVNVRLKPEGPVPLRLTVAGESHEAVAENPGTNGLARVAFAGFHIAKPGYQSFTLELVSVPKAAIGIDSLVLDGPALGTNSHFNLLPRRNAASVHLTYPVAKDTQVDGFYCEVTGLQDPTATYYMACGWHRGYFGMQVNSATERRIIFSVWDSGNEAVDRAKVAATNRVQLLGKGEGVHASDFGNEGTGGHSHLVYDWKTGERQRFYVTAKVADPSHTIYSGYYFHPEKKQWMLIASFSAPRDGGYPHGLYSFSENFWGSNGNVVRKALYGSQWIHTTGGQWQELTVASFSHDATGKKDRLDRFMGVEGNDFFLSHGGYVPGFTKYGEKFTRPSVGAHPEIVLPETP